MKKVSLIVALIALCGLAASTFADVQNIRLSGDIRVRGYYFDKSEMVGGQQIGNDAQLIAQRTRVTLEADLEDHVLVVVTLQADNIWGGTGLFNGNAGQNVRLKNNTVQVSEAYVQLRELFYSPATLKVGRQELNYGTGLIFSSVDQVYTFDAGRLVLDYHPLTIDIVGAQLKNDQLYTIAPGGGLSNPQSDLLFVNAKYEVNSVVKDVEGYFGWASQMRAGDAFGGTANGNNPSPMIFGLRTGLAPVENLTVSLEGAYEGGNSEAGFGLHDETISAYLAQAALKYTFKGVAWTPAINASYTYASGDSNVTGNSRHYFVPWFGMAEGYNGYVLAPTLSNIQIMNVGVSAKPCANTTLALQGYYYLKANKNGAVTSDANADLGGLNNANTAIGTAANDSRDVGAEIDAIVGYDYSKDVRCQLVYGAFFPENAYQSGTSVSRVVSEVRGELCVKF